MTEILNREFSFENNKKCKIFVGNVPYNCIQEEFEKSFKNIDGFIKAELITVYKTNTSRGFGFVTMNNNESAEKLKKRNDIILKGRVLRFTKYQNENNQSYFNKVNNYIYVDGIPHGKDKEWLKKCFKDYEPIGKYYIAMNHETGEYKNNGLIEVIDDSNYDKIIKKKYHNFEDNIILETVKYRTNIYNGKYMKPRKPNNNELYSAFLAGRNIGIIQGLKMIKENKKNNI